MVKIIDTNLILRLILGDIPEQIESAERLLNKYQVTVLDISIFECVYILEGNNMDRRQIMASLRSVILHPNIECNNVCLQALTLYTSQDSLSYADCYLLEATKTQKAKLYTFDKKLIKHSAGIASQP